MWHTSAYNLDYETLHLEVSVNDVQRVEVGDRLQHLAHHVTGVSLWVVALIQDPVKHLSACCSVEAGGVKCVRLGLNCGPGVFMWRIHKGSEPFGALVWAIAVKKKCPQKAPIVVPER